MPRSLVWGEKADRVGPKQYYKNCFLDGKKISLHDNVLIPQNGSPALLLHLCALWEKEGDERDSELGSEESEDEEDSEEEEEDDLPSKMLMKGRWFYQQHDMEEYGVKCGEKDVYLEAGECPASTDVNPVKLISRKARVVCLADHPGIRAPTRRQRETADFFFKQGFDTTQKKVVGFKQLLLDLQRYNVYDNFDPRLVITCQHLNNPLPPKLKPVAPGPKEREAEAGPAAEGTATERTGAEPGPHAEPGAARAREAEASQGIAPDAGAGPSGALALKLLKRRLHTTDMAGDDAGRDAKRKAGAQPGAMGMGSLEPKPSASAAAGDGKVEPKGGKEKAVGQGVSRDGSKAMHVSMPPSSTSAHPPSPTAGSRLSPATVVAVGSKQPRPPTSTLGVANAQDKAKTVPAARTSGTDGKATSNTGAGIKPAAAPPPPAPPRLAAPPPSTLKPVAPNDGSPKGPVAPARKPVTGGSSKGSTPRPSASGVGSAGGGAAKVPPVRPPTASLPVTKAHHAPGKKMTALMLSAKKHPGTQLSRLQPGFSRAPSSTVQSLAKLGVGGALSRGGSMMAAGSEDIPRARPLRRDYSREAVVLQVVKEGRALYLDNIPLQVEEGELWDVLGEHLPGLEDVRLLPCWDLEGPVLRELDMVHGRQQGYAVFRSQRAASDAQQAIADKVLLLEAGEGGLPCPLLATPAAESRWIFGVRLRPAEWEGCFHGHMLAEMSRLAREEKGLKPGELAWTQPNAYTSMHFAQPTNIEYTFAVQWALLVMQQQEERRMLLEDCRHEAERLGKRMAGLSSAARHEPS